MKGVRCFPRNTYKKYHQPLRLLSRREWPDEHHRRRGAYLHIGVQCAARADTAHLPRRTAPRLAVRRPRAHGVGARRAWERHGLRLRRRWQPCTHRGSGRQRAQPGVRRLGQPLQVQQAADGECCRYYFLFRSHARDAIVGVASQATLRLVCTVATDCR